MEGPLTVAVKAREKTLADQYETRRAKNKASKKRNFTSMQEDTSVAILAEPG